MLKTQTVAVQLADSRVALMAVIVEAPASHFSADVAEMHGFALDKPGETWSRDLTDEAIAAEISRNPTFEGHLGWARLSGDALPDRDYRGAWRLQSGTLVVDMPAAREIHRDRMRVVRAPLLEALDVESIRASEAGDEEAREAVVARKTTLRDLPADPAIEAAGTIDQLKAVWPEVLTG